MSSPFERVPGTHKFGNYDFEWLPLLKTPCYGFSGPNACYSTTCKHNPSDKFDKHLQIRNKKKQILANLQYRSSYSVQAKKSRSPSPSPTQSDTKDDCFDGCARSPSDVMCYSCEDEPTLLAQKNHCCCYAKESCYIEYGKDSKKSSKPQKVFVECTDENCQYSNCDEFYSEDGNLIGVSTKLPIGSFGLNAIVGRVSLDECHTKKHIFNPLSKPFEPARSKPETCDSPTEPTCKSNHTHSAPIPASALAPAAEPTKSELNCDDSKVASYDIYSKIHHLAENPSIKCQLPAKTDSDTKLNEFPYICILCSERYHTVDELQHHLRDKVEHPYNCTICKSGYKHRYLLQRHLNIHRILKSFKCRGCNKGFRSFRLLKRHYNDCRFKLYIF